MKKHHWALQWGRAELRGKGCERRREVYRHRPLQWGRAELRGKGFARGIDLPVTVSFNGAALNCAEKVAIRVGLQDRVIGFNGAALNCAEKGGGRGSVRGGRHLASMGPR